MNQNWKKLLLAALGIVISLIGVGSVLGETATSPLNGTVSFQTADALDDTLYVDSGPKKIEIIASQADKIQGHANSRITVVAKKGSGIVHVADVVLRDGESLYRVIGGYIGSGGDGGGGAASGWKAHYNKGDTPRIVLEVNQLGNEDNVILTTANGAKLTVTVVGILDGTSHSVALLKDSGAGTVEFSPNPLTFTGPDSKTIDLTGVNPGNIKLKGTCTGLTDGTVDALVSNLVLAEVTFGAASGTIRDVVDDMGWRVYSKPHWKRNQDPQYQSPACFERTHGGTDAKMKVTVKLTAAAGFTGPVKVRGSGNGFLFAPTDASVSSGVVTVADWAAGQSFAGAIDIFDPMELLWEFSVDGGTTWTPAGTSRNQVYVTLGTPAQTTFYHTLVHIGCKQAKGKSTQADAISSIWSVFTTRTVRRADGMKLAYYANYGTTHNTTAGLIQNRDGACDAWAKLFIDILKVQGIDQADDLVTITPIASQPSPIGSGLNNKAFLFIKEWSSVLGGGYFANQSYPYVNIPANPFVKDNVYKWDYAEFQDQQGIPGQETVNPESFFPKHTIVVINSNYYDPSYGKYYGNNFANIESDIVAGYGKVVDDGSIEINEQIIDIDLNNNGNKTDVLRVFYAFRIDKNTVDDLHKTTVNY